MKNNKMPLITGGLFTIVGIVVFFNPDIVVKFISYFLGGAMVALGGYKIVNYYVKDKNLGVVNQNELYFGITAVVLGLLFIFLAGTIEFLTRFIIGIWLIIAGGSKLSTTFYTTDRSKRFYTLLAIGFIYIAIGLYIIFVANLAFSIIGLFMAIYGIIDLISFFVNKDIKYDKKEDVKKLTIQEAEVEEKKE